MDMLLEYIVRITPGLIALTITYLLLPKKSVASRLFLLIFGFILLRDAMTPLGFWQFGVSGGTIWLRFIENEMILSALAIASLAVTLTVFYLNKQLNGYLLWFGTNKLESLGVGLLGAIIVIAPFFIMYTNIPIANRGGVVTGNLLVPLFLFALSGNFMEEVLFRGYLQGYFETITGEWRAAILSGFLFATGHIFLASTVTDLGVFVLMFTLYEGLICAFVRMKYGVIPAALTHGLTISALASGLV